MKSYEANKKSDYEYISNLLNPDNTKYLLVKRVSPLEIISDHSNDKKYFIIKNNKKLIGYYNIFLSKNKKTARVALIIDKPYRGKGFGLKTMMDIEKRAKKYGVKILKLDVLMDNIVAINLYNKIGFKETHKILFMEKKI
ncbi:MAG: GNAT family N-acetyltransferase [Candidatus Paceibacterota bacterium]